MKRTDVGNDFKKENPEAFSKLAKAMELTKGKVDTKFSKQVAEHPNSTPEIIAMLAIDNDDKYYNRIWEKNESRGDELRGEQKRDKFRFSFNDTFAARYMRKLGMGPILEDTKVFWEKPCEKSMPVDSNESFISKIKQHVSDQVVLQFNMILKVPSDIREGLFENPKLLKIWASGRTYRPDLPRWGEPYSSMSSDEYNKKNKEFHDSQLKKKGKEMAMIFNAPDEFVKALTDYVDEQSNNKNCYHSYEFTTISDIWYQNTRLEPWKLDKELELQDFYNALDYMGLGIACQKEARSCNRKGIRQFVTHVVSSTRRFEADIKRGHSVEHVRKLLVEDLNMWLKQRVEDEWRVFIRKDAVEHYPHLEPKKKKVAAKAPEPEQVVEHKEVNVREILEKAKMLPDTKEEIVQKSESAEAIQESIIERLKRLGL